jgi:hypothetical protein
MNSLWAAPYSLAFKDEIKVQVAATNSIGQGSWSLTHSDTTVRVVPSAMLPVTRGALTTETQIHIEWLPLTSLADTGNSTVTAYQVLAGIG